MTGRIRIDDAMADRMVGDARRRCIAFSGATTHAEMLQLGGTPDDFVSGCLRGYITGPGVDEFMRLARHMPKPYGRAKSPELMQQIKQQLVVAGGNNPLLPPPRRRRIVRP